MAILSARAAVLLLTGCLLGPAPAAAEARPPAGGADQHLVDWRPGGGVPIEETVRTRRALARLAFVPAGLLFGLFLYRRRAYVLAWATSWIAVGGQLLLSMRAVDLLRSVGPGPRGAGPDAGRLVMAAALACGLAASAAVLAGARWAQRPARVDRAALAAGGAAVAAIGLASLAPGLGWLLAP
ncbi:MAG: hypothetical protein AB7V01_13140, partial [Vicinamibacterales bacterium]